MAIYREGDTGVIDAGLEDSFSSCDKASLFCIKTSVVCEREVRLQSEPMGG